MDIGIRFDEVLDPTTAADATRYAVSGGVAVQSAALMPDQQTVVLQVPTLAGASYTLQVNGVQDAAGNPATLTVSGPVLTYNVQDIGNLNSPSVVYALATNVLEVQVDGGAIWFTADSANLIAQPMTGDFDVRVQVSQTSGGDFNSNMALDVRESADPASRHVAITVYPIQANWTAFDRDMTGGASAVLTGNWRIGWPSGIDFPNAWLRITHTGNSFTTYGSNDGLYWTQVGNTYTPSTPYAATLVCLASAVTDANQPPLQVEYSNFGQTVPAPAPPRLAVAAVSGAMAIQWPTNALGFQLQQTAQLGTGAAWSSVTNVPVVLGTDWQVTVATTNRASFYRLSR